MFDGTKLRLWHDDVHTRTAMQRRLRAHPVLDGAWRSRGLSSSGFEHYTAEWMGWIFNGDATHCWSFRGSIHKYHEGGKNWQDFGFGQCVSTINELCETLGLHPGALKVDSLEVGVNVVPPIPTAEVLRAIVVRGKEVPDVLHDGRTRRFNGGEVTSKNYDKANQEGYAGLVPGEVYRFEVKSNRMRSMSRKCNIHTLADLLNPEVWDRLGAFLLKEFDQLVFVEPSMPLEGLRREQRELIANAGDVGYWQGLSPKEASRKRAQLGALYAKRAPDGIPTTLRKLIACKWVKLNNGRPLHTAATSTRRTRTAKNATRGKELPNTPGQGRTANNATLVFKVAKFPVGRSAGAAVSKVEGNSEVVRVCPVCGRDITNQDARSQVCSERLYGKEGKRCRNTLSNRNLSLRRMNARSALLFDQQPYLRQSLPR